MPPSPTRIFLKKPTNFEKGEPSFTEIEMKKLNEEHAFQLSNKNVKKDVKGEDN